MPLEQHGDVAGMLDESGTRKGTQEIRHVRSREDQPIGPLHGGWAMACFSQEFGEEIDRVVNWPRSPRSG